MIFARWMLLAALLIVMCVAGLFLVPLGLMIAGGGRLPQWLRWFDNDREPYGDTARRPAIDAATGIRRAWLRFWWLAIRNPATNFGYLPWVGFAQTGARLLTQLGNPKTSDQGEAGWKFVRVYRWSPPCRLIAFELYVVAPWSATRCLRMRLGWKLDVDAWPGYALADAPTAEIVVAINPFDSFTPA